MTGWLFFLLVVAFALSMIVSMLRRCDAALREADRLLAESWDAVDDLVRAEMQAGSVRSVAKRPTATLPSCVVCDDLGCEFCGRVSA